MVADSFRSVFLKLDPTRRVNTFEIFGYDFMFDADFKPYLIEVNTNPCLELPCPLLARLIAQMLDTCFRIAIDPLFPPTDWNIAKKCNNGDLLTEIKMELMFDEVTEGKELQEMLSK